MGSDSCGRSRQHFETRDSRHLDVREHQVRLLLHQGFDGFATVGAMPDDADVGMLGEAQLDAAAGQFFIIYDDGAESVRSLRQVVARSAGIVSDTRSRGR